MSRSPPVGDREPESFEWTDRSADGLRVLAVVPAPQDSFSDRRQCKIYTLDPQKEKVHFIPLSPQSSKQTHMAPAGKGRFEGKGQAPLGKQLDFAKASSSPHGMRPSQEKRCHPLRIEDWCLAICCPSRRYQSGGLSARRTAPREPTLTSVTKWLRTLGLHLSSGLLRHTPMAPTTRMRSSPATRQMRGPISPRSCAIRNRLRKSSLRNLNSASASTLPSSCFCMHVSAAASINSTISAKTERCTRFACWSLARPLLR